MRKTLLFMTLALYSSVSQAMMEQEEGNSVVGLSLSAEGNHGIILSSILSDIERQTGANTTDLFDFTGGHATGGALAFAATAVEPDSDKPLFQIRDFEEFLVSNSGSLHQTNAVPILYEEGTNIALQLGKKSIFDFLSSKSSIRGLWKSYWEYNDTTKDTGESKKAESLFKDTNFKGAAQDFAVNIVVSGIFDYISGRYNRIQENISELSENGSTRNSFQNVNLGNIYRQFFGRATLKDISPRTLAMVRGFSDPAFEVDFNISSDTLKHTGHDYYLADLVAGTNSLAQFYSPAVVKSLHDTDPAQVLMRNKRTKTDEIDRDVCQKAIFGLKARGTSDLRNVHQLVLSVVHRPEMEGKSAIIQSDTKLAHYAVRSLDNRLSFVRVVVPYEFSKIDSEIVKTYRDTAKQVVEQLGESDLFSKLRDFKRSKDIRKAREDEKAEGVEQSIPEKDDTISDSEKPLSASYSMPREVIDELKETIQSTKKESITVNNYYVGQDYVPFHTELNEKHVDTPMPSPSVSGILTATDLSTSN